MSLNDFRKEQKYQDYANLGSNNPSRGGYLFAVILTKIVQYSALALVGCLCWNYLAPLFNLPTLSFLRMLALVVLSEVLFLRGSQK